IVAPPAAVSAIMGLLVAPGGATIEYSAASRTAAFDAAVALAAPFALVALAEAVAFCGYPVLNLAPLTPPVLPPALTSHPSAILHVSHRQRHIGAHHHHCLPIHCCPRVPHS
ncbi:hypothetical protein NYA10_30165, partial [Burkholderia thailandensis]|nr:hypothetical protein [Burkholderia thailandensis]